MSHRMTSERGFTLVELLISMVVMIGITSAIFALADPARGTFRQQPEVSDMQQRLRVGTSYVSGDLIMAGAGAPGGGAILGTLMNFLAPVQPLRLGMIASDLGSGVLYRPDAITIMYVPPDAPYTTIREDMPQPSSELKVFDQVNCPTTSSLCGFHDGQRAVIFDDEGSFDDFTITHVQDTPLHLQHNKSLPGNTLSKKYATGSHIAVLTLHTIYLNAATNQLMVYDGDQLDSAMVDNVVGLRFEYFGDPRPAFLLKPVTDLDPPWTTYGPKPPALGSTPFGKDPWEWGPGGNCIFQVDAGSGLQVPRLDDLAPNSQALVMMDEDMLTDGPFCPDSTSASRFDADLLRIRKIGVVLRVQVPSSELRGPAGALFRNAGTGFSSRMMVPDQEIRFEISPRNLNLGR
jgi:prepilin-type N-terminal cleavage/methylation domain-containing protein